MPNETIDRCVEYVKKCQNPDGGFRYMLQRGRERVSALGGGRRGAVQRGHLRRAGDRARAGVPRPVLAARAGDRQDGHFFYGHYYAVQAMWQAGGERWERWYPAIRDVLIARQQADGSWADPISLEYGTAMATIMLQMPDNSVPIFQR